LLGLSATVWFPSITFNVYMLSMLGIRRSITLIRTITKGDHPTPSTSFLSLLVGICIPQNYIRRLYQMYQVYISTKPSIVSASSAFVLVCSPAKRSRLSLRVLDVSKTTPKHIVTSSQRATNLKRRNLSM
jgi:hypothetical protein